MGACSQLFSILWRSSQLSISSSRSLRPKLSRSTGCLARLSAYSCNSAAFSHCTFENPIWWNCKKVRWNFSIPELRCSEPLRAADAGLFNSWAIPAVSVPNWAIFSLCRRINSVLRRRLVIVDNITLAAEGLVSNRYSKLAWLIESSLQSVRVLPLAKRGVWSNNDISPITSPLCRVASKTVLPPDSLRSISPAIIT